MQRSSIVALFLGAVILISAGLVVQKPLHQIYWAVNSRLPDYSHFVQSNPFLRISTGTVNHDRHYDQDLQCS